MAKNVITERVGLLVQTEACLPTEFCHHMHRISWSSGRDQLILQLFHKLICKEEIHEENVYGSCLNASYIQQYLSVKMCIFYAIQGG